MDLVYSARKLAIDTGNGALGPLFKNPIYMAIVLTAVVMIIVLIVFDQDHITKTSFYVLIANITAIFIHNKLLLQSHKDDLSEITGTNIINGAAESEYINMIEPMEL